jgi:nardilysin
MMPFAIAFRCSSYPRFGYMDGCWSVKHYYGANMRLVVVGAYTLDALQDIVVKYYSDVPGLPRDGSQPFCKGGKQSALTWDSIYESPFEQHGSPFAPSALKLYRIIPVKDRHSLSITWQLPPQFSRWKSKPCDYIGHLLGHEAQGSLLSALKKKGWVTSCVAGVGGDSLEVSRSAISGLGLAVLGDF